MYYCFVEVILYRLSAYRLYIIVVIKIDFTVTIPIIIVFYAYTAIVHKPVFVLLQFSIPFEQLRICMRKHQIFKV